MIASPLVIDTTRPDVVVVGCQPETTLDAATVQLVTDELEDLVAPAQPRDIVFDFAHAAFVSSPALTMLIHLRRGVDGLGRRVLLCGMQPHVRRLFAITRLDKLFAIHASVTEALHSAGLPTGGTISAAESTNPR